MTDTLPARLDAVCAQHADRTAIIDGATRLTFGEIADLVGRVAGHLHAIGIRPGQVVSWQLPNWWEAAILHHAVLRVGAIPNPLNPAFRARELRHILAEARPSLLAAPFSWRGFDHVALAKEMRDTVGMRYLIVRGEACSTLDLEPLITSPSPADAPPAPTDPDAIALLLYTSGTTSLPKGVQHTHRALLAEIASFREIHDLSPSDRYLGAPPVAHIAGLVYGILTPFVLGTSSVFLDRWDPAAALELIERQRATFMTGPPTFLQTMGEHLDAARRDLSSFRLYSTGGASIPTEVIRDAGARLDCVVKRAYGSTEAPTVTATRLDDDERARLESDGRPIGGNEVRIDPSGEIWVRGPELFTGYRNQGLPSFDENGWFHTGDLGFVDDDGLLHVVGRLKDIIIRGGENIAAKEIEDLLLEHPSVAEVAVFGMPDERLGERVCAVVSVRDGAGFTFEEMLGHLDGIARHKMPERLVVRDAPLPKTESGKILKDQLRAEVLAQP